MAAGRTRLFHKAGGRGVGKSLGAGANYSRHTHSEGQGAVCGIS
ncbi:hypothetical protein FTUN_8217 [Frigoriglobus tundricola]|uniref:Uncharacterized protein n=1 Tax=Frigoriglobus tundricola TaxID=2774151 RepID=A0A6M5Z4E1_9BACT|nr:hypothetical protein FTUN_8217 [Frigoriglobus tundricola]